MIYLLKKSNRNCNIVNFGSLEKKPLNSEHFLTAHDLFYVVLSVYIFSSRLLFTLTRATPEWYLVLYFSVHPSLGLTPTLPCWYLHFVLFCAPIPRSHSHPTLLVLTFCTFLCTHPSVSLPPYLVGTYILYFSVHPSLGLTPTLPCWYLLPVHFFTSIPTLTRTSAGWY